jgi:hypothetical protein
MRDSHREHYATFRVSCPSTYNMHSGAGDLWGIFAVLTGRPA